MTFSRSSSSSSSAALLVIDGAADDGRVRGLQRARALGERARCSSLLGAVGRAPDGRVLLDRLGDVVEHEPEQGERPRAAAPVTTLEGAVALARVGFRYGGPGGAARSSRSIDLDVAAGRDRRDRRAAAARARRRSSSSSPGCSSRPRARSSSTASTCATLDYRSCARHIGFVLQENYLFDDTIARNIAFGEEPDPIGVQLGARRSRTPTSSSSGCRSATRRGSARAGCGSPAARRSGSPSRAPSTTGRQC